MTSGFSHLMYRQSHVIHYDFSFLANFVFQAKNFTYTHIYILVCSFVRRVLHLLSPLPYETKI